MKPNTGKKNRIKEIIKGRHIYRKPAETNRKESSGDNFGAMVHSPNPILRLKETKSHAGWQKDLVTNCSCAVLVTTVIALFCMSIDSPVLILYALTCPLLFMTIATIGSGKPGAAKWIAAAVAAVILMVIAIIWHSGIFGGISMLINSFYDAAEDAQAYLYDRLPSGYEATEAEGKAGMAWLAGVIGLIAALPPAGMRRSISGLTVIITMLAFAYYGLIPSAICIAVMLVALIVAVSRSYSLSFIPVILIALIVFGAITLIDPGENYNISRMNENFRDRFALRSALIESEISPFDELNEEEYQQEGEDEETGENTDEEDESEPVTYVIYGFLILAAAAIAAAIYLCYRRISKKRAMIRKGINSKDSREAVSALFPYAVRWLKGYGIEQTGPSFASMEPALKLEFSESYVKSFLEMYNTWSAAVYSDHEVSEDTKNLMEEFTNSTVDQVKKKCKFIDKLKLRLRYAL